MIIIRNLIIIVLGAAIGYTFADIDLAPPLPVKHRSAWTHGPVIPLLVYLINPGWLWPYLLVTFLLANALHLARDMFPHKWSGGALIKWFPIRGAWGPGLSFVWLLLGVVASVAVFVVRYPGYLLFWR